MFEVLKESAHELYWREWVVKCEAFACLHGHVVASCEVFSHCMVVVTIAMMESYLVP